MSTMAFKPNKAFRRGMKLAMGDQRELRNRARMIQKSDPIQESWAEVGKTLRSSMETYRMKPTRTTPDEK